MEDPWGQWNVGDQVRRHNEAPVNATPITPPASSIASPTVPEDDDEVSNPEVTATAVSSPATTTPSHTQADNVTMAQAVQEPHLENQAPDCAAGPPFKAPPAEYGGPN